jgi:predicted secreted protein
MARTGADTGYGAKFQVETAPDVWTSIGEVTDIQVPERERETHDATHYESDDAYREFIPGLRDGGECTIEFNLIPGGASHDQIIDLFDSDDVESLRIVFPNDAKLNFSGFCTKVGEVIPMDDKMSGSATFKVSGKPTLADA